ncbi:TonB-dependent receptor [Brevundimonas goettingensis]|uniref:TonB-dependent receptor n=1 Tax=Brevundimonas goettingensis TaxID=2774190 RepID=A0A975C4X4_9CAUL|nr:TonB-dependent receptor [Brevundimonas goettingensis]
MAAFAAPAFAQSADPQSDEVAEVVVTGSRIPQANLVTTSPVTQVTSEDIKVAGVTRVEDLVTQLPQAFTSQNSTVSNGASGTATVSLRNLGSDRTLVLIDGRRMGYGSPADTAADLNQIPGQLVDRVEVLTGGASAVYGSDAIAGVVNFIMKKDLEGIQINAQYGMYQHHNDYDGIGNVRAEIERRGLTNPAEFKLPEDDVSDGESRDITISMGVSSPDGKGNILAYAGYRSNNPILQRDRDYSACTIAVPAATAPSTYTCGGSGTSATGQFNDFLGHNYTVSGNTFVPFSTANGAYNFGPANYYQRPDERYTLGAFGHYEINEHAEAFTQLMFNDYQSVAQIAPSGDFFNTSTLNCGNPLMSAQQKAAIECSAADIAADNTKPYYVGRRNVEGGGRQDSLTFESYRAVVGLRGLITDGWNYDIAAQFSKVRLARTYLNEFSIRRLNNALDVVSVGGVATCRSVVNGTDPNCVPYNVFSAGGVTQAALDYLQVPLVNTGTTTQQVVTAAVTGDLGVYNIQSPWAASGVKVAFGAEYRRDYLENTFDITFTSGDGAGQGSAPQNIAGDADVTDVFGEIQVPLADDQPWAYSASIDAAFRHSEYSNLSTDTYKFGADYAPTQDVRLRASFSHAVRAPNVVELFSAQSIGLVGLGGDPCSSTGTATLAQCTATGVPAANYKSAGLNNAADQYNALFGGNPNLTPEEADTFTAGVVFTPSFLPGFNASVDYFDITLDNAVSALDPTTTLDSCYNDNLASACALIHRNPANGSLWIGSGYVEATNINIGGVKTSGVDLNASYGVDLADWGAPSYGSLSLALVGTWVEKLESDDGLGQSSSVVECVGYYGVPCGVPNPEWRHRVRLGWNTPWNVSVAGTWRYYSSVEYGSSLGTSPTRLDHELEEQNYFDLSADWQITDTVSGRVGVNNVFDRDPPLTYSGDTSKNGNTYGQIYDTLGRFMFVSVSASF